MTPAAAIALLLLVGGTSAQVRYFGKELGPLAALQHGVRGRVFAVDSRTLYLQDFHYDGEGPAAYFYVGTSGSPSSSSAGATRLRDERGGAGPLRRYSGEGLTLSLPDGKTLKDYRWFAVYCDEYSVNFGDVSIPRDTQYPRPAKLSALRGVHGVSSDPLVVVDAQTLLVPNFSYDGEAPDAKFWVGRGDKPSPQGIRIPDENGKEVPLRKYDKKTIVLTLPGELTVFDIGHFAVWCEAFTVNFGHVVLPHTALAHVPPSLKMLGVSPQSKLNCEVLYDELAFEVRWAVAGDSIVLQLVAKLEDGEYMAFGVSGDNLKTQMVGGDPAVAWVDKRTLKGFAEDYYLDAKSQCAGVRGSCPDQRLVDNTNSIRLLNAALVNGYSIVTYQRSLKAADELDRAVLTNTSQAIIWAIGPLNSRNEVSYHPHFTKGDKLIEFGRPPVWNCPMPEEDDAAPDMHRSEPVRHVHTPLVIKPNPVPTPKPVAKAEPWDIPAIQCYEPPDGVFYAQMGPTGGKQGYSAITEMNPESASASSSTGGPQDSAAVDPAAPLTPEQAVLMALCQEEQARRKEEEARRQEEEVRRLEELARREEEEVRRKEELVRREEEQVRVKEELARREVELARRQQEEVRRQEELDRRQAEKVRVKEELARRRLELARREEEEIRRQEEETRRQEAEDRR